MKIRWRKALLGLLLLIGLVLTAYVIGSRVAARRFAYRWTTIRVGMTKAEVKDILGEPDDVYQVGSGGTPWETWLGNLIFDSSRERWAYGKRRTFELQSGAPFFTYANDGAFSPEDDDYVVYFSTAGEVSKTVHPYRSQ